MDFIPRYSVLLLLAASPCILIPARFYFHLMVDWSVSCPFIAMRDFSREININNQHDGRQVLKLSLDLDRCELFSL